MDTRPHSPAGGCNRAWMACGRDVRPKPDWDEE